MMMMTKDNKNYNPMRNNNYANCVGYAFEQCISSGIEVLGDIVDDASHLEMLKQLAAEYETACEVAYDNAVLPLQHPIDSKTLAAVKSATTLCALREMLG